MFFDYILFQCYFIFYLSPFDFHVFLTAMIPSFIIGNRQVSYLPCGLNVCCMIHGNARHKLVSRNGQYLWVKQWTCRFMSTWVVFCCWVFLFFVFKKKNLLCSVVVVFIWSVLRDNWFFRNFPKTPVCEINDANHSNAVLCFIDNRARQTNVTDINAQHHIMVMYSVHCTHCLSLYFPNRRWANRPKGVTGLRHENVYRPIGLYALSQERKPLVKSFIRYLSFN